VVFYRNDPITQQEVNFMADKGDFLTGLVIGGFLGFVAGIMLAPASGSETRETIADKTQTAVKETRESVEEVSEVVKENVTKVVDLVKERLPEGRDGEKKVVKEFEEESVVETGAEPV
jgi:gas vesicle protein